jgi:hypothetical protein
MQSVHAGKISLYFARCIKDITTKIPSVSEERSESTMISRWYIRTIRHAGRATNIRMLVIAIILLCGHAVGQQPSSKPDWSAFQFLLGECTGEGSGNPGQGTGIFTFSMDLQGHIIIRRNQSDYPATKTHAAFSHNDLMVMYQEPGLSAHAKYFDNEDHMIEYTISISSNGKSITFTSDSLPARPRFQLTYTSIAIDSLLITFEIAPPAAPQIFSKYIEGRAHRTKLIPDINSENKKK